MVSVIPFRVIVCICSEQISSKWIIKPTVLSSPLNIESAFRVLTTDMWSQNSCHTKNVEWFFPPNNFRGSLPLNRSERIIIPHSCGDQILEYEQILPCQRPQNTTNPDSASPESLAGRRQRSIHAKASSRLTKRRRKSPDTVFSTQPFRVSTSEKLPEIYLADAFISRKTF